MLGVRVASWNLWWRFGPWEQRQPAIRSVLETIDADVVCLQEVWSEERGRDQVRELADALGMNAARTPERFHNGLSFGNAILSRFPIEEHHSHPLPPAGGPGQRQALSAVLGGPGGPVPVICTHLEYRFDRSATRQEQVTELLRVVEGLRGQPDDHPVVLAGDLNAVPTSDEIRMLTGERPAPVPGLVMTDAWPQQGEGPGHTWDRRNPYVTDSTWPQRRIDYVLVAWPRPKPVGNVISAWLAGTEPVEGVVASDHWAVVADLVDAPDSSADATLD